MNIDPSVWGTYRDPKMLELDSKHEALVKTIQQAVQAQKSLPDIIQNVKFEAKNLIPILLEYRKTARAQQIFNLLTQLFDDDPQATFNFLGLKPGAIRFGGGKRKATRKNRASKRKTLRRRR